MEEGRWLNGSARKELTDTLRDFDRQRVRERMPDTGPHEFAPLRWRDRFGKEGECRHCYVAKANHPTPCYSPSRPIGEPVRPQRTFIYCPECKWEMVAGGEWLGQHTTSGHEGYRCNHCGHLSTWDFDMPAPILVSHRIAP